MTFIIIKKSKNPASATASAGRQEIKKSRKGEGFTLIELALVLGIFAAVAVLSMPFLQSFQVSSDLYSYVNDLNATLRRAQQQAVNGLNNSSWGVYFDSSGKKIILFKGESYTTRDQPYDQETSYPEIFNISPSFGNEIYFSLYSGQPSVSGLVTMTGPNNGIKTISVSDFGLIQIND